MSDEIQFILYHLPDEDGKVQVVIKDETIWATQKAMAQLFGVGIPAISKHLTHIFDEGELDKYTTVSKMEIVVNRGFRGEVKEDVDFYSLDAIIAVGYRMCQGDVCARGTGEWHHMPGGQVSDINFTKVNYLMHIADFLKVNIKIEAI